MTRTGAQKVVGGCRKRFEEVKYKVTEESSARQGEAKESREGALLRRANMNSFSIVDYNLSCGQIKGIDLSKDYKI